MEIQIAHRIATDSWRLNRISAIEDNLFALGHLEHIGGIESGHPEIDTALAAAEVFKQEAKQLQLLSLYEQRINRTLQKNLAALKTLQSDRIAKRKAEMEEAKKLLQLSEMKGLAYNPTNDGFVFSAAQIHAALDKERRLTRASQTDFSRHRPQKLHAKAA